ncbi:BMA-CHK-1 [Dirofilaria immitis]|nr:BMA-CHK-1 [Dirofilaria immitis]
MLDVNEERRIKIPEIEEHEFFTNNINYKVPSAKEMRGDTNKAKNTTTLPPKTTNVAPADETTNVTPIDETTNVAPIDENLSGSEVTRPLNILKKSVVENQNESDSKKLQELYDVIIQFRLKLRRLELSVSAISQPVPSNDISLTVRHASIIFNKKPVCVELLTQIDYGASQASYNFHPLTLLARRMTRFCVTKTTYEMMLIIKDRLDFKFTCMQRAPNMMSISGPRNRMRYMITIYEMMGEDGRKVMVDCRRSRGDGIEFKRAFLDFKQRLGDVICEADNVWLQRQGLVTIS